MEFFLGAVIKVLFISLFVGIVAFLWSGIKKIFGIKDDDESGNLQKSDEYRSKTVKKEVANNNDIVKMNVSKNESCLCLKDSDNNPVKVKIVQGYENGEHAKEYRVFDMIKPVLGVGLIGVRSKDIFALNVEINDNRRYACAIYLDGVNISQRNAIHSLNEIKETDRSNYKSHNGAVFILPKRGVFYIDRYSQSSGANRTFTFTDLAGAGINENLIKDNSQKNRIEVYVWEEKPIVCEDVRFSKSLPKKDVKIGAGEETNRKYATTTGLKNPQFVGKVMFVYVEESNLSHLGECVINVKGEFDDPMNLISKS